MVPHPSKSTNPWQKYVHAIYFTVTRKYYKLQRNYIFGWRKSLNIFKYFTFSTESSDCSFNFPFSFLFLYLLLKEKYLLCTVVRRYENIYKKNKIKSNYLVQDSINFYYFFRYNKSIWYSCISINLSKLSYFICN